MPSFILPKDYDVLITEDQLTQITTEQSNIDECMAQSEEEVKEYLRHRFDVEHDMRPFTVTDITSAIVAEIGDRVYDNTGKKAYLCTADTGGGGQDLTDTDYFDQSDDRNRKLVQVTIDVFLYHLHTRLNPRNIPAHRKIRYDGDGDIQKAMSATKWLLMVQKGTVTPALTATLDADGNEKQDGQSIIWGSTQVKGQRSASKYGYFTGNNTE